MFASASGKQQKEVRQLQSLRTAVRNSVLIISHITFRGCRVHIFSDNLSRNSCIFITFGNKALHSNPLSPRMPPTQTFSTSFARGCERARAGEYRDILSATSHVPISPPAIKLIVWSQAAQTHHMNADVTLACERCCVTNGYLQRLVWDRSVFLKRDKKKIKSTYPCLSFSSGTPK